MRPRGSIDRLSGMDVRAAIRRTRLPFVASLLLAALLGAPATMESVPAGPPVSAGPVIAGPVIAGPVIAGQAVAEAASAVTTAADTAVADSPAEPAGHLAARAGTPRTAAGLTDLADVSARAPRAPPTV